MSATLRRILKCCSERNGYVLLHHRHIRCSSTLCPADRDNGRQRHRNYKFLLYLGGAGVSAAAISSYLLWKDRSVINASDLDSKYGLHIATLPTYKMSEVSKHSDSKRGVWVTYKRGVYDISRFVSMHPGGEQILMAAGGSLEPFWQLYAVHKTPHVLDMLESYRIGNLDEEDVDNEMDSNNPYGKEPRRHPALKPASVTPFNAEPPPSLLVEDFLTPQELFYVRNHLPVPEIDEKDHTLEISGNSGKSKIMTMAEIKKLPKVTITAAVQCAGNRRSEMTKVKPVKGLNWGHAAIGNATWTGARLSDLLCKMGVNYTKGNHVHFEGLDVDASNTPYAASIPIEKALDPKGDVLLAYEMNGQPLTRDHGAPLRVIVPGVTGARNVKWLGRIVVSDEESDSHWQQNDYKGFSPSVDWDTVDFSKSPAIQDLPVTSAICSPAAGDSVVSSNGSIPIKGYAWSGGGRKVVRVDVSCDAGKTWHTADLVRQDGAKHPYHWAWTLWSINLPLKGKPKECEIWVKAVDSSYNTQPESFDNIWNLRGVLSNAYHRVCVKIKHN